MNHGTALLSDEDRAAVVDTVMVNNPDMAPQQVRRQGCRSVDHRLRRRPRPCASLVAPGGVVARASQAGGTARVGSGVYH